MTPQLDNQDFYSRMFIDLQAYLKSHLPELQTIDQNFAQYNQNTFRADAILPGLFIDFPETSYSGLAANDQLGMATIDLVLMFEAWSQSGHLAPDNVRERALEYYAIEGKIVSLLQGWSPGYCTPLVRTGDKSLNRNELSYRIRNLQFQTEFEYIHWPHAQVEATFVFNGSISGPNNES